MCARDNYSFRGSYYGSRQFYKIASVKDSFSPRNRAQHHAVCVKINDIQQQGRKLYFVFFYNTYIAELTYKLPNYQIDNKVYVYKSIKLNLVSCVSLLSFRSKYIIYTLVGIKDKPIYMNEHTSNDCRQLLIGNATIFDNKPLHTRIIHDKAAIKIYERNECFFSGSRSYNGISIYALYANDALYRMRARLYRKN